MNEVIIIVPTTYRPVLLSAVLHSLRNQTGRIATAILVVGRPNDSGRFGAERGDRLTRCLWLNCDSNRVTDKINTAFQWIKKPHPPECVLLADDDDLQSPTRVVESLAAIQRGVDWVGGRGYHTVELATGQTAWTTGDPELPHSAIVGPAWGFSPYLLEQLDWTWPDCERGKDRPMFDAIQAVRADVRFTDLTGAFEIVQLQHGRNLNPRPMPAEDHTWPGPVWQICGTGREMWPAWADQYVRPLLAMRSLWKLHRINAKPTPNAPEDRW